MEHKDTAKEFIIRIVLSVATAVITTVCFKLFGH